MDRTSSRERLARHEEFSSAGPARELQSEWGWQDAGASAADRGAAPVPAVARPEPRRVARPAALGIAAGAAVALLLVAGGALVLRLRAPSDGPARLDGVPPVADEPANAAPDLTPRGAAAAPASAAAAAAAAPAPAAAPGAAAAPRPATAPDLVAREEPLYAGRPLAWWNERVRALQAMAGEDAARLRAITLRRAAGLGLRERIRDGGNTIELAPEAP